MKKAGKSKEKTMKNTTIFMQNKANLSEDKFGAKHFSIRIYERFHPLAGPKNKPNQTQFKPNTKPICSNAIIGLSSFMTSKYEHLCRWRGKKTNPIQTQSNPIKLILEYRSRIPNFKSWETNQRS